MTPALFSSLIISNGDQSENSLGSGGDSNSSLDWDWVLLFLAAEKAAAGAGNFTSKNRDPIRNSFES